MLPSTHGSPQAKRHLDRFSHFCTTHCRVSSGTPGQVLSPKIAHVHGGSLLPSNAWFLKLTRAHNRNGISIGSAVSARLTSECRWACRGMPFTTKVALPVGASGPHLIRGSLGPPGSAYQTASRSLQTFFAGLKTVTDRPTDRPR